MSYCTWTGGGAVSDVYAYRAVDAVGPHWVTHVANSRLGERGVTAGLMPRMTPIGGPHDGETFSDPSLDAFRERLVALRADGYRVPDSALARIDQEIAETPGGTIVPTC